MYEFLNKKQLPRKDASAFCFFDDGHEEISLDKSLNDHMQQSQNILLEDGDKYMIEVSRKKK